MPELPEVEATRRYLISQGVVGRAIAGAELQWPGAVRLPTPEGFRTGVSGRCIQDVRRRGKYLSLRLSGDPVRTLVLHLRMTGSLVVRRSGDGRPRHTRNVLLLDGGGEICFVDPRKLGTMWLVEDEAEVLGGLGPEPLGPEFTPQALAERLSDREAPVKALLCDQALVAGIGNIYADEALFCAGIHPMTRGDDLSPEDSERLHQAIVSRLAEATEQVAAEVDGGGTLRYAEEGGGLLFPRSKEARCPRCDSIVERVVIRGRGSYFCAGCQGR